MITDLYTIQIVFTDGPYQELATSAVEQMMKETEENLTDLLPPGYRARIRRWDNPGGENDE